MKDSGVLDKHIQYQKRIYGTSKRIITDLMKKNPAISRQEKDKH